MDGIHAAYQGKRYQALNQEGENMQKIIGKLKSINSFTLLCVGMIILANPMIALFDIIPDFIGCALIMFSLRKLAPVASELDDAFNCFKYMIIASVVRMLIAMSSAQFDSVTLLSASIILGIAEFIIAYMAFSALADGMATIKLKFSYGPREPIELKNVSLVFFGARGLCSLLPYVSSVLDKDEEIISPLSAAEGPDYSGILMLVNIVITIIFAVFFIMTVINHLGKAAKNQALKQEIADAIFEKRTVTPEYFTRKTLTFALTLLAYSSLFLIDFIAGMPMGGRSFIPDFGFGIFAIWAILLMKKYLSGYKKPLISGIIYTVISAASFFVYNDFLSRHYLTDFNLLLKGFLGQYAVAVAFAVAESAALIVFTVMLVKYLLPIITNYSAPVIPEEFVRLRAQSEKNTKRTLRMMTAFKICLIIIAVSGTALVALLQLFDVGYDDIDFPYLLAHIAMHIAFYAFSSTLFLRLRSAVINKYETPDDVI